MKAAVHLDCGRFAQNDVEPFCVTVDSSANKFFYAMALQQETKLLAKSVLSQYLKYSNLLGGPTLRSLTPQLPLKCHLLRKVRVEGGWAVWMGHTLAFPSG